MSNTALITGASSGIGRELAREHAKRGGDLILVARRESNMLELKAELEKAHNIKVMVLARDLAGFDAAEALYKEVKAENIQVDILINNAGFGGYGKFHERNWAEDKNMIQLNIETLTALTHFFLKDMVERDSGRVMNVSSVGGFLPGPLEAVYYATKAFVLSFSQAIGNEIHDTNVSVTALCPGATKTEFSEKAGMDDLIGFKLMEVSVEFVAAYGYKEMLKGRRVAIPGFINKFFTVLLRVLPRVGVRALSRLTLEKF